MPALMLAMALPAVAGSPEPQTPGDLAIALRTLRAAGVPEELVEDLVRGNAERLVLEMLAGQRKRQPVEFEQLRFGTQNDPARVLDDYVGTQVYIARAARLAGPGKAQERLDKLVAVVRYDFLDETKALALHRILEEQAGILSSAMTNGSPTVAEIMRVNECQRETARKMEQLLGPGDLLQYNLRFTPLAIQLRQELALFRPDKAEFTSIFKLRQEYEQALAEAYNLPGPERNKRLEFIKTRLDEGLQAKLPASRLVQYRRSQDSDFREWARMFEAEPKAAELLDTLYELKGRLAAEYIRIKRDVQGDAGRRLAWEDIQSAAAGKIKPLLSPESFEQFRHQDSAAWLQRPAP